MLRPESPWELTALLQTLAGFKGAVAPLNKANREMGKTGKEGKEMEEGNKKEEEQKGMEGDTLDINSWLRLRNK